MQMVSLVNFTANTSEIKHIMTKFRIKLQPSELTVIVLVVRVNKLEARTERKIINKLSILTVTVQCFSFIFIDSYSTDM